jgi:hypothetical protein
MLVLKMLRKSAISKKKNRAKTDHRGQSKDGWLLAGAPSVADQGRQTQEPPDPLQPRRHGELEEGSIFFSGLLEVQSRFCFVFLIDL